MRRLSRILAFGMAACMTATAFVGCNGDTGSSETSSGGSGSGETGKVYYLNFKPEQDKQWQDLAKSTQRRPAYK